MARVVHAGRGQGAQQRRGHGTRRGRGAGARGSGGGSPVAAGGTRGGREDEEGACSRHKKWKMTTTSYVFPLLYRVPAGRPATPPQGSALAPGFIS